MQEINQQENTITFLVSCSKGTYIRTVCEELATRLGTVGTMVKLVRTQVGEFSLQNSVSMETIKQAEENAYSLIEQKLITIEQLFQREKKIELSERKKEQFEHGVKLKFCLPDGVYRVYQGEYFVGIGKLENELLKREIVL